MGLNKQQLEQLAKAAENLVASGACLEDIALELDDRARTMALAKSSTKGTPLNFPKNFGPEELDNTEKVIGDSFNDSLANEVKARFQDASKLLAQRHLERVLNYRSIYLTEQILAKLGGPLPELLDRAGLAVAKAVVHTFGEAGEARLKQKTPTISDRTGALSDPSAIGQVAAAASQAIQQTALNVQRLITVAIEESRTADAANPKYSYPP